METEGARFWLDKVLLSSIWLLGCVSFDMLVCILFNLKRYTSF